MRSGALLHLLPQGLERAAQANVVLAQVIALVNERRVLPQLGAVLALRAALRGPEFACQLRVLLLDEFALPVRVECVLHELRAVRAAAAPAAPERRPPGVVVVVVVVVVTEAS